MSEIAPPSPTPPPPAQAVLQRILVTTAPTALADLPAGTKLDTLVAEIIDATRIKVSSKLGDISLKLPGQITLKTGDALIVQLLSGGANPRVQLTGSDGRPFVFTGTQTQGAAPQPGTTAASQLTSPATVQITPGGIVTATLLRPVSVNAAHILQSQGNLRTQPASGSAPVQSTPGGTGPGLSAPANVPTIGSTGSTQVAGQLAATAGNQTTGQAVAGKGGIATFPTGSGLGLRIVSMSLPSATPSNLTPGPVEGQISLAPGATLNGVVSGRQGIGQTVVQTHAGPISLPTAQALPSGTEIRFEVMSLNAPAAGAALHSALHAGGAPLLDGEWFAFDEALDVLQSAAPSAHQHVMQAALPRADAQLATNVLFFLSALRGGEIKNWLGDGPVRVLDRMRPDLAGRLRNDMMQMTRPVEDPANGDWRLHGVPFLYGAEIDRIQLLTRDQGDGDDDPSGKGGTRFVVDLNLSRLGHLQIDGLVGEKNKRLDLVLRTDEPLEPNVREDIRRIYNDALELTGLEGSVGFQANPGNFVNIPKRAPGVENGGVMA